MSVTQRLESMSPRGFIRLMRENDGDICVTVAEGGPNGEIETIATIQICTPFGGGGGSPETYGALIQLMAAMARDNLDKTYNGRKPDDVDDAQQRELVRWGAECIKLS